MLKAYIRRAQPRYREGQIVYLCAGPKSHLLAACERPVKTQADTWLTFITFTAVCDELQQSGA